MNSCSFYTSLSLHYFCPNSNVMETNRRHFFNITSHCNAYEHNTLSSEDCLTGKISIKLYIILFFSLTVLMSGCGRSGDGGNSRNWTLFRGDTGLSGFAETNIPEKPVLLWSYKSDSRTSSSPVVYDKTTYWCDKRGRVFGVDFDGNLIFDYNFATAVEATPMIHDSVLYIGRIDGIMSALSLTKKDTLWTFETMGQIMASPNIGVLNGRDVIVFGSYDNYLYCIDKQNGKELNKFESGYYINGAAAFWKNYIISGGCDALLKIIDVTTGLVTDSLFMDTYIPASPAIRDNHCYVGDHSGNVYDIVIEGGKIASWQKIVDVKDNDGTLVSVPAVSAKILYVLSDDRNLYAIDRNDGNIRWKYLQKGSSGESSPLVCGNKVISCSKNGIVSILNATNGELLWEYDTGEQITSCPAVISGRFYILTEKGTLFCFGGKS